MEGNTNQKPDSTVVPATEQIEDKPGNTPKTFTQEEVDKTVQERLARAKVKSDEAQKDAIAKALAEYDRKQKLTDEQRIKEELGERENALKQREAEITLRENRSSAIEQLSKAGVSTDLVDLVVDIDPKTTEENAQKLKKAFDDAVSKAVESKLAGKAPEDFGDGSKPTKTKKAVFGKGGITHSDGSMSF